MNIPYAVIPLGILFLYLYLFSFFLVRAGIYRKSTHRRIWNYILLITFFISALSGLFIALQINYKWEFTWIDAFLKWHVDLGIALSFTGIFHFTWHWSYYFGKKKRSREVSAKAYRPDHLPPVPGINLFHLGFSTLTMQVMVIRAGLSLFDGNEMVTGLIVGVWMLSTGLGALAGKNSLRPIGTEYSGLNGLLVTGILPVVLISALYLVKTWLFPFGTSPGITMTIVITTLVILPYCFISGLYFTVYAARMKKGQFDFAGMAYSYESAGSLVSGLFTGLIAVFLFNIFQTLLVVLLLTLIIAGYTWYRAVRNRLTFVLAGTAVLLFLLFFPGFSLQELVFKGQELIKIKQTPYGQIAVTGTSGQINIYEDNVLLFSGHDIVNNEEAVHYPLSQLKKSDTLLLISGGYKGLLNEMLKYDPDRIDYTETDPALIILARTYTDSLNIPNDPRVSYIPGQDAIAYLKSTDTKYNGVIINTPAPFTLSGNRYYSMEFLNLVKHHLDPAGVVSLSLPTGYNYSNESAMELNSVVFNTLKSFFTNVLIIQGQKNYFLASDSDLSTDIPALIRSLGINTTYVNEYYLNSDDLKMRTEMFVSGLDQRAGLNTIERPRAFFLALSYWASMYGTTMKAVMYSILALSLLLFILYFRKPVLLNMFIAGFSSAGLEILFLFALQSDLGNLYQYSALLLGLFMAGLAIGSWYGSKPGMTAPRDCMYRGLILIILAAAGSVFIPGLFMAGSGWIISVVLILTLLTSVATGYIFSTASRSLETTGTSRIAMLYSSDVFGGALGALVITLAMIPLIGFRWSSVCIAALAGISLVRLSFGK